MENLIVIAMGIALLYVAIKFRLNTQKISEHGIKTEGMIIDTVQGDNIDSPTNYPLIRFVTSEKEWITEKYNVSTGFFKKGRKVIIVYNSNNPKEFFVKSPITSLVPILLMILAIIILATGVCKLLHI